MAINSYYETLRTLTQSIQVTDKKGKSLGLTPGFCQAISLIANCARQGKKLMFIGNGASASISSHMAVDFWKHGGVRAVAFNDPSLLTCISNDYCYEQVFAQPIRMFADKGDILVAISSSGKSANVLAAAKEAASKGVRLITLSGFKEQNPLRKCGNINFFVPFSSYGQVEVLHHSICHCLLDNLVSKKGKNE